jgi:hypothetical protein
MTRREDRAAGLSEDPRNAALAYVSAVGLDLVGTGGPSPAFASHKKNRHVLHFSIKTSLLLYVVMIYSIK